MDKIRLVGGNPLRGSIRVGGAKNAALPVLFSSLLTDQTCRFRRLPRVSDIDFTLKILEALGAKVSNMSDSNAVEISTATLTEFEAEYDLVRKMRASALVLGPLLARFGKAKVSLPGGCAIGARPIDIHLKGLELLGAEIKIEGGYVVARSSKLRGAKLPLEFPSVGATENLIMAAVLAKGETVIENAAKEPEIISLVEALKKMSAVIEGEGTSTIQIQGKESLEGCDYEVIGDRIEAGTFLVSALATGGTVEVIGISPHFLDSLLLKLEEIGGKIERGTDSITLRSEGPTRGTEVRTEPYPGFPTDMQAQLMALLSLAPGKSKITENVFENRFMHVPELLRLGADIKISGKSALIKGVPYLKGAPIMATDLRASASLIIAGLCAKGETIINRVYHIDRGYERVEEKFRSLGAQIERIS